MGKPKKDQKAKKWDKKLTKGLKKKFENFKKVIERFMKNHGKDFKDGSFTPMQFKIDTDSNGALVYTVQYEVENNDVVQATIYQPPVVLDADGVAAATQPDPEVTQFINTDGTVTGAMGLKMSFVMMATAIATVMLS